MNCIVNHTLIPLFSQCRTLFTLFCTCFNHYYYASPYNFDGPSTDCAQLCLNQYVLAVITCHALRSAFSSQGCDRRGTCCPLAHSFSLGYPITRSAIQTSLGAFEFACMFVNCSVNPHSPVGIASRYGFDGQGIEFW